MPAHDPRDDLALLIDAARAAADLALSFAGQSPQVWHKPDEAGPVTEADLAVDAMLRDRLTAARPDYGWLSEETPDTSDRLARDAIFIVDPIDGTRGFIANGRDWGHSLAIAHRGRITAAVLLMPRMDKCYTAARGFGAALNGTPLSASARTDSDGGTILARKSLMGAEHWPGGPPRMDPTLRSPMAYRLAALAEGRFDAAFTPLPVWDWDLAAGMLLLEESGHTTTDHHGAALTFNRPHPRAPGILAANPVLHAALLSRRA